MIDSEIKNNLLSVIKSCDTVQFCSFGLNSYPETRTIANKINKESKSNELELYFITNINSHKIEQIRKNNNICLYYFNQDTRKALTLFGIATEVIDKKTKDTFWNDTWKMYGFQNKDDKNYTVIKVTPKIYKYYVGQMNEKTGNID